VPLGSGGLSESRPKAVENYFWKARFSRGSENEAKDEFWTKILILSFEDADRDANLLNFVRCWKMRNFKYVALLSGLKALTY